MPINRVSAAKAGSKKPRRDKTEQRAEETVSIDTETITLPKGTSETLALYSSG